MRFSVPSVSVLAAVVVGTTSVLANEIEESSSLFSRDMDMVLALEAREEAIENYIRELENLDLESREVSDLMERDLVEELTSLEARDYSGKSKKFRKNRKYGKKYGKKGKKGGKRGRKQRKNRPQAQTPVSNEVQETGASAAGDATAQATGVEEATSQAAREFDDELELREFGDDLDLREFDDELELRGFEDDLETREPGKFKAFGKGVKKFKGGRSKKFGKKRFGKGKGRGRAGGRKFRQQNSQPSSQAQAEDGAPGAEAGAEETPVAREEALVLKARDFIALNEDLEMRELFD